MSVIFALIHDNDDVISLCADKQATDLSAEKASPDLVTKIHKWTPHIGVGHGGNYFIGNEILRTIHDGLPEALDSYKLEELADFVFDLYPTLRENYDFIKDEDHAECIFAGTLSTGKLGLIYTRVGGGDPIKYVYDYETAPTVMVLPYDMEMDECESLLQKAIKNTVNKKVHTRDIYEASLRKAVRYVSEHSEWVGHNADYFTVAKK